MIIVKIMGGLGNQMFQYAFGKALSLERNEDVFYDTSFYQDKNILIDEQKKGINRRLALYHFNVNLPESPAPSPIVYNWKRVVNKIYACVPFLSKITIPVIKTLTYIFFREYDFDETYPKIDQKYHPEVWNIKSKKINFIGYWQSEKYFIKYKDEIFHDFQMITPQCKKNITWSNLIVNSNSVSLHVRRGDYPPEWILDSEYYSHAIEHIVKHVDNPVFFVFSDDIQWVKNNLKIPYETHYVDQNNQADAYEDMRLMSQCKHNIIANSSFSWWGAWLNRNPNKIVIAPKGWIQGININDIIPERWIQI